MKMRWWIGILLLLNVIALAWQWDAFARWGWGPNVQREPERLQQQIQPEALKVGIPSQEASTPSVATEPTAPVVVASEPAVSAPVPAPASAPVPAPAASKVAAPEANPSPTKPASK